MKKLGLTLYAAIAMAINVVQAEELKFAHVYETSEPFHKWAEWAAQEIEKRTEGRYSIKVFPASTLGKEADLNEGLQLGTVDIIYTGAGFLGRLYKPLNVVGESYMFRDFNHWKSFTESDYFKELSSGFQKETGNVVLALNYYGTRHVTANKAIINPEDMRNLRVRIPNAKLYMIFPEAVGANPTPLAFDEVYLALQQGVVDAQENPLTTIKAKGFYEVQSHISLTGHIIDSLATIASGGLWERLSDEDKKIFQDVFYETANNNTAETLKGEDELLAFFKEKGKVINEVDTTMFRDLVVNYKKDKLKGWNIDAYERVQKIGR